MNKEKVNYEKKYNELIKLIQELENQAVNDMQVNPAHAIYHKGYRDAMRWLLAVEKHK